MRYLQGFAVVALILSVLFFGWANNRYYSSLNSDHPQITNTQEVLELSVEDPPEAIFRGLTARDATDGELTDQLMVASVSHFLEPGTVNVKYVVFDSHNNSDTLTRKVRYTDYTPPVYALEVPPVYTVGSPFDLLDHIRVTDCLDGDLSDNIRVISNTVNNFTPGNYPVVLEVSNSCGDTAQITLWVTYQSKTGTARVGLHQYILYLEQGETFTPENLLAGAADREGNALDPKKVRVLGNLDTQTPGCYQLTYSYEEDGLSGLAPLTVVVTERQG